MSNEVTAYTSSLPVDVREQMAEAVSADLDRLGATGGRDTIRITQDKKFQLPDDTITEGPLSLVVVDWVYRYEYYPGAFKRNELVAPSCFAVGEHQAELTPTPHSPMLQVKPGELCSTCQWDKFGSSPQGDGKACKNTIFMALLQGDSTDDTPLWVLKTSPTAIAPFKQHAAKIMRTLNLPVYGVLTRIFFDPSVTYASLRFGVDGTNPVLEQTMKRRELARARLLTEPDFSSAQKA